MRVRVLGTAAGGGFPQWNCGCAQCAWARAAGVSRTQDCLAVTGDGTAWYLLNASPDLGRQLTAAPELAPPAGTRDTPIRGVLCTSGELDHTIGLLSLREGRSLDVYAPCEVPFRDVLAAYTTVRWHPEPFPLDGGLRVTAVPLSDKRPRYAAGAPDGVRVVGYRITDGRRSLSYAPGIRDWEPALCDADLVFLDGTFATADEMPGIAGHLPIADSLPLLPAGPRYRYTHVNNTNPANRPDWPGHAALAAVGAAVATDGEVFSLDG